MELTKETIFFGSILVSITSAYFAIKYKSLKNGENIANMKDELLKEIKNNNKITEAITQDHDKKINKIFTKIDRIFDDLENIKLHNDKFITYDTLSKNYTKKETFNIVIDELKENDKKLSNSIKELKKEVSEKIDKLSDNFIHYAEMTKGDREMMLSLLEDIKKGNIK